MRNYHQCEVALDFDDANGSITAEWTIGSTKYPRTTSDTRYPTELLEEVRDRSAEEAREKGTANRERIDLGCDLFRAMMPTSLCAKIVGHLGSIIENGDAVRIALRYMKPKLELLPWELAYDADKFRHLALVDGISIVRLGDTDHVDPTIGELGPLRIFFVDAGRMASEEYTTLTGDSRQRCEIQDELIAYEPRNLDGIRWEDVAGQLPHWSANAFHFTGHGLPGDESDPCLVFSGRGHIPEKVGCAPLGQALSDAGIKLAVIAACSTGVDDYWAGMGASLLRNGVPAVVSMQAPLDDAGGDIFARELYRSLGEGESLDDAVAGARRAVASDSKFADWWLPVLHTRATDQICFAPMVKTSPAATQAPPSYRLPRTPGSIPMSTTDKPMLWKPRHVPPDATGTITLSSDGRACALMADRCAVQVGILGLDGEVHWWDPAAVDQGTTIIAVHAHAFSTELLISADGATQLLQVDNHGHPHVSNRWPDRATSGAWTGSGFTWINDSSSAKTDETNDPLPIPAEGCTFLDAAIGDGHRLASWMHGDDLVVCRTVLNSRVPGEMRSIRLDFAADALVVARSSGGVPTMVFVGVADKFLGRTWDSLLPTS